MSRRSFLKAAAATAVVAVAGGAGGAFVARELASETAAAPSFVAIADQATRPSTVTGAPAAQTTIVDNSDLARQLAAAQADNARLQTELDLAQRRIAELEGRSAVVGDEQSALQAQLASANERIGVLAGLAALYDRLNVDELDDAFRAGLGAVGGAVGNLVDDLPSLGDGIAVGRRALDNVETQLPLVEAGRNWLLNHLARISAAYAAVESMLQAAVERVGPVLSMLAEWVESVLKWLPFGLGNKTAALVDAVGRLLDATPVTVGGAQVNTLAALELWLGRADEAYTPLLDDVVRPLRDQVLARMDGALVKADAVQQTVRQELADPLTTALERQRAVRAEIADYRNRHGV